MNNFVIKVTLPFLCILFIILSIYSMYMVGIAYQKDSGLLYNAEQTQQLQTLTKGPLTLIETGFLFIQTYDRLLEETIENRIIKIRFSLVQLFT